MTDKPKKPARKRVRKAKAKAGEGAPLEAPPKADPRANLMPAWQPGQSGNPAGRQKGSRNRLTEAFVSDLFDDWREHGKEAIKATREEKPAEYLKVVAGLAPKKIEVREDPLDAFDDDELSAALAAIAALRKAGGDRSEDRIEASAAGGAKPH